MSKQKDKEEGRKRDDLIKELYERHYSMKWIADAFNLTRQRVHQILKEKV